MDSNEYESGQLFDDAIAAVKLLDRIDAGDLRAKLAFELANLRLHYPEELDKELPAIMRRAQFTRVK
jgi:hypothetical protein